MRPDYQDLFTSKYGGAFDLMHEIDLAIWYAGLSVTRVAGFSGTYSDIGIEAPDLAEILIDFSRSRNSERPPRFSSTPAASCHGTHLYARRCHGRVRTMESLHCFVFRRDGSRMAAQ